MAFIGIIFILIGAVILLSWLPLLGVGIFRLKKYGARPGGIIMTVFGGLGGIFSVFIISIIVLISYQVNSIINQKVFDGATFEGPTGIVQLPFSSNATICVMQDDGETMTSSAEGTSVPLPEGDFTLYYMSFSKKGDDGKEWTLSIDPREGEDEISIKKDKPVILQVALPLTVSVESRVNGDKFTLSMKMKDKHGNSASLRSGAPGKTGFQILSLDGKILQQGNFEYG